MLSEKEIDLEEKENQLIKVKNRLEELEGLLEENKKELLLMKEMKVEAIQTEEEQVESIEKEEEEIKSKELIQRIEFLLNESNELKKTFDLEKLDLIQHYEITEVRNRESMEKLREKLENEKVVLNGNLLDKERDIEKLKKDMDDMRDNIKEMHQSHQTRLTTLTNQLNQQYNENIDKLKSNHMDEKLKYENELEKTNTVIILLKRIFFCVLISKL